MIALLNQALSFKALGASDWLGAAPLLCVTAGILVALCAEVIGSFRPARDIAFDNY